MNGGECKVCLGVHDRVIHGATERLHSWLKERLERAMAPLPQPKRAMSQRPNQLTIRGSGKP